MAAHPGDSGDWCLDTTRRQSPAQRSGQSMSVVSPEVLRAMAAEDAFLATISGRPDTKRFTDRRPIPRRERETP